MAERIFVEDWYKLIASATEQHIVDPLAATTVELDAFWFNVHGTERPEFEGGIRILGHPIVEVSSLSVGW